LKSNIKTYLILHPDRRDFIDRRWFSDPDVEIFDAIIPPPAGKIEISSKECVSLTPGELGCTLSHYSILRKALTRDQGYKYYLILEDDLEYKSNWLEDLIDLINISGEMFDMFCLSHALSRGNDSCRTVINKEPYIDRYVMEKGNGPGGAVAWLSTGATIKILYDLYQVKFSVADGMWNFHNTKDMVIYTTGNVLTRPQSSFFRPASNPRLWVSTIREN
tara:strand:+ start:57 stop:713 length:657 start_codon:yes stop_codon:yes gene_type:complete